MIKKDRPKLALNFETLRKLQSPPPNGSEVRMSHTHPTTTVNTRLSGCC